MAPLFQKYPLGTNRQICTIGGQFQGFILSVSDVLVSGVKLFDIVLPHSGRVVVLHTAEMKNISKINALRLSTGRS